MADDSLSSLDLNALADRLGRVEHGLSRLSLDTERSLFEFGERLQQGLVRLNLGEPERLPQMAALEATPEPETRGEGVRAESPQASGGLPEFPEAVAPERAASLPDLPAYEPTPGPEAPAMPEAARQPPREPSADLPDFEKFTATPEPVATPSMPEVPAYEPGGVPEAFRSPAGQPRGEGGFPAYPEGEAPSPGSFPPFPPGLRAQRMADGSVVFEGEEGGEQRAAPSPAAEETTWGDTPHRGEALDELRQSILAGVEAMLEARERGRNQQQEPVPPGGWVSRLQQPGMEWPDFGQHEDYAAASPAFNVTSMTGSRGAGGWSLGSGRFSNTPRDRLEPSSRHPLG